MVYQIGCVLLIRDMYNLLGKEQDMEKHILPLKDLAASETRSGAHASPEARGPTILSKEGDEMLQDNRLDYNTDSNV